MPERSQRDKEPSHLSFPVEEIRRDFPLLRQKINDHPIVYLDNAASTQQPQIVIDALGRYCQEQHANVHRGVHTLSLCATEAYEKTRHKVSRFLNARDWQEIVYTRGTTEAINLVAQGWGRKFLQPGDEILLTQMEHHSNIVPWQLLTQQTGAQLRYIPLIPETGLLDETALDSVFSNKTKIVSFAHVSNVLGTASPVQEIIKRARQVGALVVMDGAQSAPHCPIDVQALDCDFFAFSAHKMCGPTGLGILYGKRERLEEMDPWMGGGEMIDQVDWYQSTWNEVPYKFEAGTPPIAAAIAFGVSIEYLERLGMQAIHDYEIYLTQYARERLQQIDDLTIYGAENHSTGVLSMNIKGIHPFDLGQCLDQDGIAIRTGHHCAQPLMKVLGIPGTARVSFYFYNTVQEIQRLLECIETAKAILL